MAVYVDEPIWKYGRMKMCHMLADTEQELHEMADNIGVSRRNYQSKTKYKHYDICKVKRELAIENGAFAITSKQIVLRFGLNKQPTTGMGE